MKKSIFAAINSIKISRKKAEVNSANSTKSSSAISKSPASAIAAHPMAKFNGDPTTPPGKKDKNTASVIRKSEKEKVGGSVDEMKIQRKLPERKMRKEEKSSAPRKVITPSNAVSKTGGKTDRGKAKPERDLALKELPPLKSSEKKFDEIRDVILDEAEKRNDSTNQLPSSIKEEMVMSSVVNVGGGSEIAVMMTNDNLGDTSSGCPLEIVLEFLKAVMIRDYKTALKLAKEVQQHEPDNALVKEYMLVLGGLAIDEVEWSEESSSAGDSDASSSSSSEETSSSESESDGSWETHSATSAEGEKDDDDNPQSDSSSDNKSINERKVWKP